MTTILWVAVASGAAAQWSESPAANLALADRSGDQVQTKLVATQDGGFFASWFDNSTGGYDVTLQRLDAAGNEQWAHDGVLVLNRGFSSTQDYGLGIDAAGNALLAFRDDSGPATEITAARVGPDGTLLWGAAGIQVSSAGGFVAAPKIVGTTDGNIVVAWTHDAEIVLQKLDPSGTPLWGSGVSFSPAAGSYSVSDLHASDSGTAIVSFTHLTGSFPSPIHLLAQKVDAATGAVLWGSSPVAIYDVSGGSLQIGNFPPFVTDGAGGAIFAWYTSSPSLQCRVQRVLANGTEAFPHQGVEVSTQGTRLRVSPSAAWDPAGQEIYTFWTEENTSQSQFGLYGQKIDSSGVRQWTDEGKQLVALSSEQITNVRAFLFGTDPAVAWARTVAFGNQPIHAARLDGAGDFVWTPSIVDLATSSTATSRISAAASSLGFAAFGWQDGDSGTADILAQNVNADGSLGFAGIFADGFESGDTSSWSLAVP
ncbi:MAG: hypothetical protein K0U98_11995 [Deltaproteobacteria bacterium]|nr:hypothetical protein [Deltaproteobacteria bacterium]